MIRNRRALLALGGLVVVLALSACAAGQAPAATEPGAPGFLHGLWHGFIAPITFVVSLFSDTVRIYAVPHSGLWYDLGFMLGLGGFSGGIFKSSGTSSRKG